MKRCLGALCALALALGAPGCGDDDDDQVFADAEPRFDADTTDAGPTPDGPTFDAAVPDATPGLPDATEIADAMVSEFGPKVEIQAIRIGSGDCASAKCVGHNTSSFARADIVDAARFTVICKAEPNDMTMTPVDADGGVVVTVIAGSSVQDVTATPTPSPGIFEAPFDVAAFPNDALEVRCTAADTDTPPNVNSDTILNFLDLGPKVLSFNPVSGAHYATQIEALIQVLPQPVDAADAVGAPGLAGVGSVELCLAGAAVLDDPAPPSTGGFFTTTIYFDYAAYVADPGFTTPLQLCGTDVAGPEPAWAPPIDGAASVRLRATNDRGVMRERVIGFVADSVGPTVNIIEPAEGQLVGGFLTVRATVTDPAGVSDVRATIAHTEEIAMVAVGGDEYRGTFDTRGLNPDFVRPLVEVRARDGVGNEAGSGRQVVLDNQPPYLDFDPPAVREGEPISSSVCLQTIDAQAHKECSGESCATCPGDCGDCGTCGDSVCSVGESCLEDCGPCECGDGLCLGTESAATCAADCAEVCGDGACTAGEDSVGCPGDCDPACGDATCDGAAGEDCVTCGVDCGPCDACGDGGCDASEDCSSCPADCGLPRCGDGVCGAGEDCTRCPGDCGACAGCGDGTCDDGAPSACSAGPVPGDAGYVLADDGCCRRRSDCLATWYAGIGLETQAGRDCAEQCLQTYGCDSCFECSLQFDPVGPEAVDTGDIVGQLGKFRVRVEDTGNHPAVLPPGEKLPLATTDETSVQMLVFDNAELAAGGASDVVPMLEDTDADGVCDTINPTLIPTTVPMTPDEMAVIDLDPIFPFGTPQHCAPATSCSYGADLGLMADGSCVDYELANFVDPVCGTTSLKRIIAAERGSGPAIYGIPPLGCMGDLFDALAANVAEGWACVLATAEDKLGNVGLSRPMPVCFYYGAGAPPAGVCDPADQPVCTDGCAYPASFVDDPDFQFVERTPECSDGIDNDEDGLIDYPADPFCTSPDDPVEE